MQISKAIEDANDAWTRVGKAFDGIWNQLSVLLAPAFEWLADTIVEVIKWVRDMVDWFKNLSGVWKMLIAVASSCCRGDHVGCGCVE